MLTGSGDNEMQIGFQGAKLHRFCSDESFDRALDSSEHFFCVASLGSLVPGWLLVVPRRPCLNLSELSPAEQSDFSQFAIKVSERVKALFGEFVLFEHGPNVVGSSAGCGVDQAHLHVVPIFRTRFLDAVRASGLEFQSTPFAWPHELVQSGREYLWHSDGTNSAIAYVSAPERQFYRRAVARAVCRPQEWDYKLHPAMENIGKTQGALL